VSGFQTTGRRIYQLSFELSPIVLQGGLAGSIGGGIAGGYIPIVALLEGIDLVTGLLADGTVPDPDNFFAHFRPIAGSTLFRQEIGRYPFANQSIAANATIFQPQNVSLLMVCPANPPGGVAAKLATMMALKFTLAEHARQGGTFIVATPSGIWTNCILLDLVDASSGESKQPQEAWRWDFEQPLVTMNQATQAQNGLMTKITNGLPTSGALSGPDAVPGLPLSGAAPVTDPVAGDLLGTSLSGGFDITTPSVPAIQSSPAGGTSFIQ
jgi:hypothetical protein